MKRDGASCAEFSGLVPERVLDLVEDALGCRCSGLCRPLTSYINRVYEVELASRDWVIVKFYRPGRWSRAALQDEQDFVSELLEEDIPVVAALQGRDGNFLQERDGMFFAVYPRKAGRPLEEPTDEQRLQLGRTLGRVHAVGARRKPRDRMVIHPRHSTRIHLDYFLTAPHVEIPPSLRTAYQRLTSEMTREIAPLFDAADYVRVHGDCHVLNILGRPEESFHLIDFDDMAWGPPVQDLWMLLPGHLKESRAELECLLEGYETFHSFDRGQLALIEPLRAMRFIHYTAWCARQKNDGGFSRLAPGWGTPEFWRQEIQDLERQRQEIRDFSG